MATPIAQQRKIEDKLAIVDSGLQSALKAMESISESDIRATSYADGISIFKMLRGRIEGALSERRKINYFK